MGIARAYDIEVWRENKVEARKRSNKRETGGAFPHSLSFGDVLHRQQSERRFVAKLRDLSRAQKEDPGSELRVLSDSSKSPADSETAPRFPSRRSYGERALVPHYFAKETAFGRFFSRVQKVVK